MNVRLFKAALLDALLAYAPDIYLRFLRGGRLAQGARRRLVQQSASASRLEQARRVLVVDSDFPDPTRNAGSKAIYHVVETLVEAGAELSFWSTSRSPSAKGEELLRRMGVRTAARQRRRDLSTWLGSMGCTRPFDAIVLSRPSNAAIYGADARLLGSDHCVYYGHDIHFLRLQNMRAAVPGSGARFELACMRRIERRIWRSQDLILYPSEEEAGYVNAYRSSLSLVANAEVLPLWAAPEAPELEPVPTGRRGMLFVGSYEHAPNVDGLDWFFREVLPLVRARGCDEPVYVVGAGMEQYVPPVASPTVEILGWLDESALQLMYERVRVALVPLRYGGGVKGKILDAMAHGIPCVTTTAAAHGLWDALSLLEPRDDADGFAETLLRLSSENSLWVDRSAQSLAFLHRAYSRDAFRTRITKLILRS
ncbi:MAG: glycosyltransferase [Rhodanobacter sp.]